jgi:outer membrane lipoprotein carrier protein
VARVSKPALFHGIFSAAFAVSFALAGICLPRALAQTAPPASALELAQRVDRHYDRLHSLKAAFTESYAGLGVRRSESGTLLLAKPGRMKWEYNSPAGKLFVLDGHYAWFYTPGDPQAERIPAKELDDLRSPLRFLLGHTQIEKELDGLSMTPASNGFYTLAGRPKGQEKRVARLALTVTAVGTITGIEIEEADGAITRFIFAGEQTDAALPPHAFDFAPPKGVAVIDALPPV